MSDSWKLENDTTHGQTDSTAAADHSGKHAADKSDTRDILVTSYEDAIRGCFAETVYVEFRLKGLHRLISSNLSSELN